MHAGISTSCGPESTFVPTELTKCQLEGRLNGTLPASLALIPVKISAVVRYDRFVKYWICQRRLPDLLFHKLQQNHLGPIALTGA